MVYLDHEFKYSEENHGNPTTNKVNLTTNT